MIATALSTFAAEGSDSNFASIDVAAWQWGVFAALVVTLLLVDVLVIHRKPHAIEFKEAAIESAVWITIGVAFTGVVAWWFGAQASGEYIAGYLIEKSLSVDNVFVWAVIFSYFAVPSKYQFRTLFWGIFGALVLRAIFIFAGVELIESFTITLAVFGIILLYSAWKIASHHEAQVDPDKSVVLRAVRKVVPSTDEFDGQKLFTRRNGKLLATPLFAVLIMVESTDVVFAVDSIPAILAVSREQFIVLSSNAFAILGLRALYFCLNGLQDKFRYLNYGLGAILGFVGVKMLLTFSADAFAFPSEDFHFPIFLSLVVIIGILTVTIVASLRADKRDGGPSPEAFAPAPGEGDDDLTTSKTPGPAPAEEDHTTERADR